MLAEVLTVWLDKVLMLERHGVSLVGDNNDKCVEALLKMVDGVTDTSCLLYTSPSPRD